MSPFLVLTLKIERIQRTLFKIIIIHLLIQTAPLSYLISVNAKQEQVAFALFSYEYRTV